MAKKKNRPIENDLGERTSPLVPHAILWIGFLVVLAIGVVTVFIPEIEDDGANEDDGAVLVDDESVAEPSADGAEPASP